MAYITKKTTVNGVKPIGSNLFGTCSTASDAVQKVVTMADFDVLVSGVTIHVQFTYKNTASNPTLKVGSTSAVAIMCNGASEGNWEDGAVISFTYNGTNWIQNDASEGGGGQEYPYVSDVDYDADLFMAFGVTRQLDENTTSLYNVTVQGVGKIERDGDDLKVYNYAPTGHSSATHGVQTISLVPSGLVDMFYPVGSYYETSDASFDPNTAWGGTWSLEASGQVHVSAGTGYAIGGTGGSTTHHHSTGNHTLTASEIPAHTHGNKSLTGYFTIRKHGTGGANEVITRSGIVSSIGSTGSGSQTNGATGSISTSLNQVNFDASHTHDSVGGSGAHNHGNTGDSSNMMPYIVVNRWHRTA